MSKPESKPANIDPDLLDFLGDGVNLTIIEKESKKGVPPSQVVIFNTNPVLKEVDLRKVRDHFKGTKARIFRHLFSCGYEIKDIHKACEIMLWPGLRYQQVYNAHVQWKARQEKVEAQELADKLFMEQAKHLKGKKEGKS